MYTMHLKMTQQQNQSFNPIVNTVDVALLTKQMSAKKGITIFGEKGEEAIVSEIHQIHDRKVIEPVQPDIMSLCDTSCF